MCIRDRLYADLKIGTAAPTPEQLQRVQHHFVGTLKLTDYYSAAQYEAEVMKLLEDLFTKHNTILLTGGSMMYVDVYKRQQLHHLQSRRLHGRRHPRLHRPPDCGGKCRKTERERTVRQ